MPRSSLSHAQLLLKRPLSTLSVTEFLRAIRRAPSHQRLRLFRALLPFLVQTESESLRMEICKFDSLENYPTAFARFAQLLGHPKQLPAPDELAFLHSIANRRVHWPGAIGGQEYLFLTALASILAPRRALEIGTSSGFSSALMAAALHRP